MRELVFPLSENMEPTKRAYYRIHCLGNEKSSFPKIKRDLLWEETQICLESNSLTKIQKNNVRGYLLDSYYKSHTYEAAEGIATDLQHETDVKIQTIVTLADFYIKTRRYNKAETILNSALQKSPHDEKSISIALAECEKRRNGKGYYPASREDKEKYIDFMNNIGFNLTAPVNKKEKAAERLKDYPPFPKVKKAGFKSFVAYDLETTGINSSRDSIIEIGAVRVVDGVVNETEKFVFQTFVRPYGKKISDKITGLTGITPDMVADAPEMWDAFNAFADFLRDDILIGYNSENFDNKFLMRAGRYAKRIITNECFDVLSYARSMKQKISYDKTNIKLGNVSGFLGIENPQAHRALADAVTTAKVYLKLLDYDK